MANLSELAEILQEMDFKRKCSQSARRRPSLPTSMIQTDIIPYLVYWQDHLFTSIICWIALLKWLSNFHGKLIFMEEKNAYTKDKYFILMSLSEKGHKNDTLEISSRAFLKERLMWFLWGHSFVQSIVLKHWLFCYAFFGSSYFLLHVLVSILFKAAIAYVVKILSRTWFLQW